ncbi:50S ribosomal protein L19 [bacterium]|nr:50S ribosomal protein L19 [bacterium]
MKKLIEFTEKYKKKALPDIKPGDTVKVYERFFDRNKERIQVFEGIVIARKHGSEIGATITVRRVLDGVGVEKTFPLHSPTIQKIEIVKRSKVRRAKLYYLRNIIGKIRLRRKDVDLELLQPKEEPAQEKEEQKDVEQEQVEEIKGAVETQSKEAKEETEQPEEKPREQGTEETTPKKQEETEKPQESAETTETKEEKPVEISEPAGEEQKSEEEKKENQ